MTVLRIWRTRIDGARIDEYERFAAEQSLPMFTAQPGCTGVLFTRRDDMVAVLSLWRDRAAVASLDGSPSYQQTVRRIGGAGFLVGEASVEVFEVHGGSIDGLGERLISR